MPDAQLIFLRLSQRAYAAADRPRFGRRRLYYFATLSPRMMVDTTSWKTTGFLSRAAE